MAVEIFLNLNFSFMSIFKFFCGILLSAHLIACGFLFIGFTEEDGWLSENYMLETYNELYVASIYWAFTYVLDILFVFLHFLTHMLSLLPFRTMTTIGYGMLTTSLVSLIQLLSHCILCKSGDIKAITVNERLFATFCMIFGGVVFTYGVTRVVGIVSTMGKSHMNLMTQVCCEMPPYNTRN